MSVLEHPPLPVGGAVMVGVDVSHLTQDELVAYLQERSPDAANRPAPLAQLLASLDALAEINLADVPPDEALALAGALVRAQDQVQALALRSVADVERRDLYQLDGNGSTGSWVAEQQTRLRRSAVALARRLDRFGQVADRVAAGGMSVDDAGTVTQALVRLRPHVDRPDGLIDGQPAEQALYGVIVNGVCQLVGESRAGLAADDPLIVDLHARLTEVASAPLPELTRLESAFVLLVRHLPDSKHLRTALALLTDALLPNQLADRADDAHRNRSLELTRDPDGSGWRVRGWLDDETGELLHTTLTAAMETDPDNPADTAAAQELREAGEDPIDLLDPQARGCDQPRSRTQRRHDALKLVLRKIVDSRVLGTRGKLPVQINVTISEQALHDQPGALPARTGSGATIPARQVRAWLCDSAITRYVLGLAGRVVESSHTDRTLKPHERRIKQIETGGICQAAACTRGSPTGHVLIPHHVEAYAKNGTTSLDDTVLFCEVSHDDIHIGGKTLRLKDGRWINEHGWAEKP